MNQLLPQIMEIAESAAERVLSYYVGGSFEVTVKADSSPVTSADIASQELIVEALSRVSQLPVIAEEEGRQVLAAADHRSFWLVDPLDGTKDFLAGNGEFTVNIGLIED